ncbi:MAG: hypothetical protein WBG11_02760, partial [Methylocella sp.]
MTESRKRFQFLATLPRRKSSAGSARRAWQRRANPRFQIVFLLGARIAGAPASIEAGQAFDPALFEKLAPAADRGAVEQKRMGGLPAAPPV